MSHIKFKGKSLVVNHHLAVPFHELVPQPKLSVLAKGANVSLHDNLILHGDNLLALKALLPTYGGKVNCIYIDPPYNTGNEGWCYNDNVANPMTKEWLGKVVDKDDLTRHDKWLCMMYPRLTLLHELLAEDGVIFISIDDNEVHRLRMLMDEIFGEDNFIGNIIVKSNPGGRDYGGIAQTHDYVLCYVKNVNTELNLIVDKNKKFLMHDEIGGFEVRELRNRNIRFNSENRPNLYYPFYINTNKTDTNGLYEVSLTKKKGWKELYPMQSQGINTVWRWGKEKVKENININIAGKSKQDGGYQIIEKYRSLEKRERSIWDETNLRNEQGTLTLKFIFNNKTVFDYAKSNFLTNKIVSLGANKDSIILDSFAGSGTTAQAVLELNKEDGGNRKFILVECEDYADKITAERVRRVIKGVKDAKHENLRDGLGGTFSFWQLGNPIELKGILTKGKLPTYEELARYIFYTATGEQWNEKKMKKRINYIGDSRLYEVYLLYASDIEKIKTLALTLDGTDALPPATKGKTRLVFAPSRYINMDELGYRRIKYCQLPFEIYKLVGGK